MNEKYILILLLLFLNQIFLLGQEVEELQLIREEKIEQIENDSSTFHFSILDHKGNFVTPLNNFFTDKHLVDFNIDGVDFKLDRFLFARVHEEANRLFTFGKHPFPSDCGTTPCTMHGFRIYDLKGNLIKNDTTIFNSTSNKGFAISKEGNLYITDKLLTSDSFFVRKYDLNGVLQWEKKFPLLYHNINIKISEDETIAIGNTQIRSFSDTRVYIVNGKSGQLIWEETMFYRLNRIIFFNDDDIVYINGIYQLLQYSIKNDSLFKIDVYFPSSSKGLISESTGKYFGGITYTDSKTEIPFLLFKKVNDEFILFRKLDLSKHNFKKNSSNQITPLFNIEIDSKGKVTFLSSDKKLIFM